MRRPGGVACVRYAFFYFLGVGVALPPPGLAQQAPSFLGHTQPLLLAQSYPAPYYPSSSDMLPPPPPPPGEYDPNAAAKDEADNADRVYIAMLPFGIGQFQNHKYLLGLVFAAGELGALYYWQSQHALANSTEANVQAFYSADCNNSQDAALVAVCTQYLATTQAYVKTLNEYAQYGLVAFGFLYLYGVIQALVDQPAPPGPPKKKKKKKRPFFGQADDQDTAANDEEEHVTEADLYSFNWHFDVIPAFNPQLSSLKPSVNLQLNWQF